MIRSNISREILFKLYCEEKLSAPAIARHLGVSTSTIYARLSEYKIQTRSSSEAAVINRGLTISCSELQEWYTQHELSIYQIAEKYNCTPTAIWKHLKKCNIEIRPIGGAEIEYPKRAFSGDLCIKAYLIGLRLGDLHVERGSRAIRVRCTSTRAEQIDLIRQLFEEYGGVWISRPIKRRGTGITVHLNLSFEFLLYHQDRIEEWILTDTSLFAAFWAGYLDAEGSFINGAKKAYFKVDSYDRGILHQAWIKLAELGIEFPPPRLVRLAGTHVGEVTSQCDLWRLSSERKSTLLQLCSLIEPYLKHKKRYQDMQQLQKRIAMRHSGETTSD